MAKIYSKDFRECVVQNIQEGMSRKDAVRIFKVGLRTISNWISWVKERNDLSTKKRGRYKARKISDESLLAFIENNEDSTLEEIAQHFSVVKSAIFKRLKLLKITRKKNNSIHRTRRTKARRI